jgi:hypothetical protein
VARESTLEEAVTTKTFIRAHPMYYEERQTPKGETYYLVKKYQPCCHICGWVGLGWPDRLGAKELARTHEEANH